MLCAFVIFWSDIYMKISLSSLKLFSNLFSEWTAEMCQNAILRSTVKTEHIYMCKVFLNSRLPVNIDWQMSHSISTSQNIAFSISSDWLLCFLTYFALIFAILFIIGHFIFVLFSNLKTLKYKKWDKTCLRIVIWDTTECNFLNVHLRPCSNHESKITRKTIINESMFVC